MPRSNKPAHPSLLFYPFFPPLHPWFLSQSIYYFIVPLPPSLWPLLSSSLFLTTALSESEGFLASWPVISNRGSYSKELVNNVSGFSLCCGPAQSSQDSVEPPHLLHGHLDGNLMGSNSNCSLLLCHFLWLHFLIHINLIWNIIGIPPCLSYFRLLPISLPR